MGSWFSRLFGGGSANQNEEPLMGNLFVSVWCHVPTFLSKEVALVSCRSVLRRRDRKRNPSQRLSRPKRPAKA